MNARVFVTLKSGVLDPQGQAVVRSLGTLGFPEVEDARLGKMIELRIAGTDAAVARTRLDEMCLRLLSNPIIEDYRIEIVG